MTDRSYHPLRPVPIAYDALSRRPENIDISSWKGEISNGVHASMGAASTGPLRSNLPRELDGGVLSTELG